MLFQLPCLKKYQLTTYLLNRSFRPCRGKLSNEHDQRKYPSFELIPFVVRAKTNCEREKRLNLNKRRNKICSFFHLLCLMNIKMQTSLGKFKCNLNQTPMPLLFCKPLNSKARLSHAEETLANQHDPRMSSKIKPLLFLSRVGNNFSLVVQTRTHKRKKGNTFSIFLVHWLTSRPHTPLKLAMSFHSKYPTQGAKFDSVLQTRLKHEM